MQRGFSSAWRSASFGATKSRPREGAATTGAAHMHRVQRAARNRPGSTRETRHFLVALANFVYNSLPWDCVRCVKRVMPLSSKDMWDVLRGSCNETSCDCRRYVVFCSPDDSTANAIHCDYCNHCPAAHG
ncbi:hypothetical protein MRX96_049373 [Rhipicephalus microplus]